MSLCFASIIISISGRSVFHSSPIFHQIVWLKSHEKKRCRVVSSALSSHRTHLVESTWKFNQLIMSLVFSLSNLICHSLNNSAQLTLNRTRSKLRSTAHETASLKAKVSITKECMQSMLPSIPRNHLALFCIVFFIGCPQVCSSKHRHHWLAKHVHALHGCELLHVYVIIMCITWSFIRKMQASSKAVHFWSEEKLTVPVQSFLHAK
jgi:hypothetical protein